MKYKTLGFWVAKRIYTQSPVVVRNYSPYDISTEFTVFLKRARHICFIRLIVRIHVVHTGREYETNDSLDISQNNFLYKTEMNL